MAETVSYKIVCNEKTSSGTGEKSSCSRQEAMMRGFIAWGLLWVIMIPSIFIPIVHFVAVPALFFAGPIVGRMLFKLYNGKENIRITDAVCPNCQGKLFLPGAKENWPVHQVCMGCKTSYSATLSE